MILVSDNQLRIVAGAAVLLPAEARGTFLRRVVAEVREGQNFENSDIERAVRVALLDESMKEASVSSTKQCGGKRRSDTPTVSQEASHPFTAFLRRIASLVHLRGLPRSFNLINSVNSRCGKSCGMLMRHFELGQRHVRAGGAHRSSARNRGAP